MMPVACSRSLQIYRLTMASDNTPMSTKASNRVNPHSQLLVHNFSSIPSSYDVIISGGTGGGGVGGHSPPNTTWVGGIGARTMLT